ncbi:MAG: hypothetical protein HOQ24_06885 [Mycobacteriaceae bacterium]|nr:hypothetical protein [Mycobacteriaceae bacterium]
MTAELPELAVLWARWAVLAAAAVAVGSGRGPRILPSLGLFETPLDDGSTLVLLPGGRAVLSGGTHTDLPLEAVGSRGGPKFFAGAPDWLSDPVLDTRAMSGRLSFCYWWDAGHWFRAESPHPEYCAAAIPGVWERAAVVDIVTGLIAKRSSRELDDAVDHWVSAAEFGVVTSDVVERVFPDRDRYDLDGALSQLSLAGLTIPVSEEISADEAIDRVREHIRERGLESSRYPLSQLRADRISVGWMVYVPVPRGRLAIGRSVFYVADDGVLEHSSSSFAPSQYALGFEQRYRHRNPPPVDNVG